MSWYFLFLYYIFSHRKWFFLFTKISTVARLVHRQRKKNILDRNLVYYLPVTCNYHVLLTSFAAAWKYFLVLLDVHKPILILFWTLVWQFLQFRDSDWHRLQRRSFVISSGKGHFHHFAGEAQRSTSSIRGAVYGTPIQCLSGKGIAVEIFTKKCGKLSDERFKSQLLLKIRKVSNWDWWQQ